MRVRRLLADEPRDDASNPNREHILAGGRDCQLHQARLRRRGDEGKGLRRRLGRGVFENRQDETICEIRWQIEMFGVDLFISVLVSRRNRWRCEKTVVSSNHRQAYRQEHDPADACLPAFMHKTLVLRHRADDRRVSTDQIPLRA